jgi:ketosteroid isomerase-like protein
VSSATTTDEQVLAATLVCTMLSGRYCHAFDTRDLDAYVDLFTEDGAFTGVTKKSVLGRDELRAFLAGRPPNEGHGHIAHAPAVLNASDTEIEAYTPFARYTSAEEAIDAWGHYLDTIILDADGRWRFKSRTSIVTWMSMSFANPA